jgi:hypothetical protein
MPCSKTHTPKANINEKYSIFLIEKIMRSMTMGNPSIPMNFHKCFHEIHNLTTNYKNVHGHIMIQEAP